MDEKGLSRDRILAELDEAFNNDHHFMDGRILASMCTAPNELAIDIAYARKFSQNFASALTLQFLRSDLTGGGIEGGEEYNPGISIGTDLSVYFQKETRTISPSC